MGTWRVRRKIHRTGGFEGPFRQLQFESRKLQVDPLPEKTRHQRPKLGALYGKPVNGEFAFQVASSQKCGRGSARESQPGQKATFLKSRTEGRFELRQARRRQLQAKSFGPFCRQVVVVATKHGLLSEGSGKMGQVERRGTKLGPPFGLLQGNGDSGRREDGIR